MLQFCTSKNSKKSNPHDEMRVTKNRCGIRKRRHSIDNARYPSWTGACGHLQKYFACCKILLHDIRKKWICAMTQTSNLKFARVKLQCNVWWILSISHSAWAFAKKYAACRMTMHLQDRTGGCRGSGANASRRDCFWVRVCPPPGLCFLHINRVPSNVDSRLSDVVLVYVIYSIYIYISYVCITD